MKVYELIQKLQLIENQELEVVVDNGEAFVDILEVEYDDSHMPAVLISLDV